MKDEQATSDSVPGIRQPIPNLLSHEDELAGAHYTIALQDIEKKQREADLVIANKELAYQNTEKEKRAQELLIANRELLFQNSEKEKRAQELVIANRELLFQNEEKEKRAQELIIANRELLFQNEEKEKRAAELIIANKELAYQNAEKEKRAEELSIANEELRKAEDDIRKLNDEDIRKLNDELEKKVMTRTAELEAVNKELEAFCYSISHDLRSPLRAVNGFAKIIEEDYYNLFDDEGKRLLTIVQANAQKMGILIDNLLAFSRLGRKALHKKKVDMNVSIENILRDMRMVTPLRATIKTDRLDTVLADQTLMDQVWINLLSNAIKYSGNAAEPMIHIKSMRKVNEVIFSVADNGVGFDMLYAHKLFGVFQRLHDADEFEGTGVGLALVHRIVTRHGGKVWAEATVGSGACFYFSLPDHTPAVASAK